MQICTVRETADKCVSKAEIFAFSTYLEHVPTTYHIYVSIRRDEGNKK